MSSSGPPVDHPRCNQVRRLRRESRPRFAAPSYRRREAEPLADAGVNIHIDADGLIRDNRERLRLGADMFACAALHIQNIGAWRQRSAIFSIPIRGNSRDFFSPVPAYDDQRIFGIGFRRDGRRVSVRKLNRFPGNDMQMSLHETWPHIIRGNAPDRSQEEAADNQVLEKQYPTSLKIQAG